MIKKGLIIDEPWIGYILNGDKTWEMRSTNTSIVGDIALIRKGSGTIVAVAKLVHSSGPLSREEMLSSTEKHRIPSEMIYRGEVDKWRYAWELSNVRRLEKPVPYSHSNGAVIWVNLESRICNQIQAEVMLLPSDPPMVSQVKEEDMVHSPRTSVHLEGTKDFVPFARDLTCFNRSLNSRGYFQVGAKGEEAKYDEYEEALRALRRMRTAHWRRPNSNGNWGIVAAVRWAHFR